MKMYRLKKEAVPFFKEALATQVHSFDTWEQLKVDEKALEEVKPVHLKYGIPMGGDVNSRSATLGGWNENGAEFHFTLCFPSMKFMEYDKFHNGKVVRGMMEKIQSNMDYYFNDFINDEAIKKATE